MYRVLVADGEFATREALRAVIGAMEGFEVVHAVGNGEKAVTLCCTEPVDIAFLATALPGVSGLEAARRIHECVPALPLVLVTAADSAAFAKQALQYNEGGYITKPLSFAAVRDILLAHKSTHAVESPALAESLRDVIAARDFPRAYKRIPAYTEDVISRAGESGKGRRELLDRLGQRILATLDPLGERGGQGGRLPVFDEHRLSVTNGVALNFFEMLDTVFRRNCLADYPVMRKAFCFVDNNITEKIGLGDLVANAHASQTHISRIFKRCFTLSVMDYLHLRKIHVAKMRFTYADHSVSEAAFALQYSEVGYFKKVFKKYEGITVQQYKALLRQ